MKFALDIDKKRLDEQVALHLGAIFTEEYLRQLFLKNKKLLGACSDGIDTYEREWLAEVISEDLIGMTIPCNGDSEEYSKEFWAKLEECLKTSPNVDVEATLKLNAKAV